MNDFILILGEMIWTPGRLDVSVLCMMWVVLDPEQTEPELLVSSGSDKRLRAWKREEGEEGMMGGLKMWEMFAAQRGVVLALAQNSTYLAAASGMCY